MQILYKVVRQRLIICSMLVVAGVFGTKAQPSFELEYITEFQTNFGRNHNWVNFLELYGGLPTESISNRWRNGSFHAQLVFTYRIHKNRVINDLLNYSDITKEPLPFSVFKFGYQHRWGRFSLFGGVRNVEEDFFTKPYMSLFTNHTARMGPTLALNFALADMPLGAMCLHAEFQITDNLLFKTSLYNGIAHEQERRPLRSFRVDPQNDGLLSISQLSFTQNRIDRGNYAFGVAIHTKGEPSWSFFGNIEQTLFENNRIEIGLLLQGGFSPLSSNKPFMGEPKCRSFLGIGGHFRGLLSRDKREAFGIYLATADFVHTRERILEITWQYQLINQIAIQPAFHVVQTGSNTRNVGLLRLIFTI